MVMMGGGRECHDFLSSGSTVSRRVFIVSQHQFFRRETLQGSGKNWVSEKFMHDGVVSRSSIETFQSQSTATLRGEPFCVSKIV